MKNNVLRVLFIGDIVGKPGRNVVKKLLPGLITQHKIDFVVANGENIAGGKGMTKETYDEMITCGVDYFTSGNHIWKNRDIIPFMKDKSVKVLRPANYPDDPPGDGFVNLEINGNKVIIANLMGRVFIPELFDDPFAKANEIASSNSDSILLVDFHGEATSEKIALAYYLDGKATAVIGTHTHVQTSDERILPKGTGFITDIGMCGPYESVLGVDKDIIIEGFLTGMPQSHKVAVGDSIFSACLLEIDTKSKKTVRIKRISEIVK